MIKQHQYEAGKSEMQFGVSRANRQLHKPDEPQQRRARRFDSRCTYVKLAPVLIELIKPTDEEDKEGAKHAEMTAAIARSYTPSLMDRNQDAHRSHSLPAMAWSESVNFGVRNKIVCALAEAEHPAIVTGGVDNKILGVNRSWCELCDYQASECLDKSPKILQGCGTDFYEAKKFAQRLANKSGGDGDVCAALLNYTKAGVPFLHILRGRAIYDPSTGSKYYITESSGRKLDNFEEHMLGVADAELVKRRSTRCSSESSQ